MFNDLHYAKMRFPILTLLCALLVGSCLVSAETINAILCRRKNGDLTDMIKKFCSNNYMSVPGPYAWNGVRPKSPWPLI